MLLPSGLGLKIDNIDIGRAGFVRCLPSGCVAEVVMDDKLLDQVRTGKTGTFIIFQTRKKASASRLRSPASRTVSKSCLDFETPFRRGGAVSYTSAEESGCNKPAPKAQPPRKRSGPKDRERDGALESGGSTRPPKRVTRTIVSGEIFQVARQRGRGA